ncbi:MAG: hypothetical protein MK141_14095 [Pseudoxanthomonas sp.]|uniref:hypothetical protein n=1 Tax=Pseudoxanthomonas sp. TaxID=1871049 RepID=UPI00258909EA|nr:hypothetical protein [Pseudoxanthomonas sp.]MCH2092690.1 hypothetical protein [Pseudoxanthomonas sp.]
MTISTEGFGEVIRTALRAAEAPMSLDDIARGYVGTVNASELSAIRRGLSTIMRQRVEAGEVVRHHNPDGVLRYSLNLEHRGRGRNSRAAKAAPVPAAKVDAVLAPPPAETPARQASQVVEQQATATTTGQVPARAAAPTVAPPKFKPVAPTPEERDFVQRLVGLCTGLEDLIGDACDARLDHEFIKALIVSQGAAHRALRISGRPE